MIEEHVALLVERLTGHFQRRYEPNFAWKSACSLHQGLGGLRGYWPLSSSDESGNAYDLSGQGRTLTYGGDPVYAADGLRWYVDLDGVDDRLSRTDEAGLSITGAETFIDAPGLTCGAWVRFDADTLYPGAEYILTKWNTSAQRSYALYRDELGQAGFIVSSNGVATLEVDSTAVMDGLEWYFVAGRFTPSASLDVWVDDEQTAAVVGVPASIFDSTANFTLGARQGPADAMAGRICHAWLCAAALPDAAVWSVFQQTRALFGK